MSAIVNIDARTLGATGLGTYARDLLANFASEPGEFRFRVLCKRASEIDGLPRDRFEFVQATSAIYGAREQYEIAWLAQKGDLLHCTHYNVPRLYRGRLVVTIHDLTHLTHRQFLPNRFAYYYAKSTLKAAARHACRIITVSQFSRKCICDRLGVCEAKVRVIPFGPQDRRLLRLGAPNPACLQKMGITQPYLLFVGLLKPHKNVQGLLRGFASLPAQLRERHQLVIAGKLDNYYPTLQKLSEELQLQDRVRFTGHVSDDELHALYSGAEAFVLPSLNEGFGLPVLEAMAYGLPVIVSNSSSLPEVAGDAGIYVDPADYRSIARGIERVVSDPDFRQRSSERSRERAKAFDAREFARQHLQVYREALAS